MIAGGHEREGESGDGFVTLADGSCRWGRFGAAGVLVRCADGGGGFDYFVVRRSALCHQGGTWAVPGGALNRGEDPLAGALREFAEEVGVELTAFDLVARHDDDHGGWSYTTVVLEVAERFTPTALNWESDAADWVAAHRLAELELLVPFRTTLARLGLVPATDPG